MPPNQPGKASGEAERFVVQGREVTLSNPGKVLFPKPKHTKRDLVNYYLAVAAGALRGAATTPDAQRFWPMRRRCYAASGSDALPDFRE